MTDAVLSVRGVAKAFGTRQAVVDVDLDLRPGRITALLGPSGCGKSTLLRLIAGLESLDAGEVRAGDRLLSTAHEAVPPEHRGIGLVFQDFALFPHLRVIDNVAFGLTGPRAGRRQRALDWLERVHLADRADAWPHALSGGEQQRVALVRALAREPRAVLLDEPFSGLDRHLRTEVRETLVAALRSAGAAVLVVTHDAEEALLMADDLALMDHGRILQVGTPLEAYQRPVSPAAARLLGEAQILPVEIRGGTAHGALGALASPGVEDGPGWLMIRPEDVILATGQTGTVEAVGFGGAFQEVRVGVAGQSVRVRTAGAPPAPGAGVDLAVASGRARIYPREA